MSIPSSIDEMFEESKEMDIKQKIVEEILNENNLDRKTELAKPIQWSVMGTMANFLKEKGFEKAFEILDGFMTTSYKLLISKDRKGRQEYVEVLKSVTLHQNIPTPLDNKKNLMG